ncbi:MAG: hypothetical protein CVV13_04050 [Gammaproteobacteria bacterium HGW-Gammaproteobacteria-3]|nr:MAG: hypothetical protein CVV13_04050 [Gammaproteobacteria bacterium HGW-Gammaproteobacteria-3]
MPRFSIIILMAASLAVSSCVSIPDGPSVMVLPGSTLSFQQFRNDDAVCQLYAKAQVGGVTPKQASVESGLTSAVVGTALGAAVGAAIDGGSGAAIGAGSGLAGGTIVGTGAASSSAYEAQQRYDIAYIQCMYAKGHQVPVSGSFSTQPAASTIPPPPPGSPPPPPK